MSDALPPPPQRQAGAVDKKKAQQFTLRRYMEKLWPALVIAAVFGIVKRILLRILRAYGPADFRSATPRKQDRAMLYLFSCINAVISCAPFFFEIPLYLKNRSVLPNPYNNIDPRTGGRVGFEDDATARREAERKWRTGIAVHTITGYLLHDLIAILPEAKEYASSVVHHIVTIIIGLSITMRIEQAYAHVPLFFLCEASTLALNGSWFVREFPATATKLITDTGFASLLRLLKQKPAWTPADCYTYTRDVVMPRIFAGSFTVVRVVDFPLAFWNAWNAPVTIRDGEGAVVEETRAMRIMMGDFGTTALGIVTGLQFYWFALIVKKIIAPARA